MTELFPELPPLAPPAPTVIETFPVTPEEIVLSMNPPAPPPPP
jgi:hypothetical protein